MMQYLYAVLYVWSNFGMMLYWLHMMYASCIDCVDYMMYRLFVTLASNHILLVFPIFFLSVEFILWFTDSFV